MIVAITIGTVILSCVYSVEIVWDADVRRGQITLRFRDGGKALQGCIVFIAQVDGNYGSGRVLAGARRLDSIRCR